MESVKLVNPGTTPNPAKKHKSSHKHHHHSDKSSKKHSKSKSSSSNADGHHMTVPTVKKESGTSPAKKKPMISDDSEDEIPMAVSQPTVKEEPGAANANSAAHNSIPGHAHNSNSALPATVKVKSERHPEATPTTATTPSTKVKVERDSAPSKTPVAAKADREAKPGGSKVKSGEKRKSKVGNSDVPMAKRKPPPRSLSSEAVGTPSKATPHKGKAAAAAAAAPPPPASSSAKRRRAESSGSEESEYDGDEEEDEEEEDSEEDDEDFKPSSAKKPKKATPSRPAPKPTPKKKGKPAPPPPPPAKPPTRKPTTPATKAKKAAAKTPATASPAKGGGRKKKEDEAPVWKWWEEEKLPKGVKWRTLEHRGPYFAPPYEPLPPEVQFLYDGKPMQLREKAEEAAGFFAKMLDHDYTTKDVFCDNFFQDWRKEMTSEERGVIVDFSKCNFTQIHQHYKDRSEARKAMSKEEKLVLKAENEKLVEEYGWCTIDGHKEKIGNFKIEPPGLFRGRGDHPKQGRIKRRIDAKDVLINIGKAAKVPSPPPGQRWKEVQHDSKVTWLASWTENIQGSIKYVMLNPTSRLKAEKDWGKYETARKLKAHVGKIREQYKEDLKAKEMKIRQRAVAMYFIDKLALRAGNEKDTDETADTVGCCSLRVEHITTHEEKDGKEYVLEFDFLGKDSIRYYNCVPVDRQVFKNVRLFQKDKTGGDDLFDRLTTSLLNKHLTELMENLTAKVFRTYNASNTLQEQLDELTAEDDTVASKILSYNRANRAVAILCNHQRAAPKTFDKQMSNLQGKIEGKEDAITEVKAEIKVLRKEARTTKDSKTTKKLDTKQRQLSRLEEQLDKLEIQATDKQENKEIALGTSKLNYLDPRISVAWCKKWSVPVEKVYNKTQRQKFAWAIDMAGEDFAF